VLLTLEWQLYAPWLYLHHLEGFRGDATVVDVNLCRRSWYVGQYLPATHPEIMAAVQPEAGAFLVKLEDWEHDRPHDPEELTRLFNALLDAMLRAPLPDREAHVTLPTEPGIGGGLAWAPHGLTMRLSTGPVGTAEPMPTLHLEPLLGDPASLTPVARSKVRSYYALMLANRGRYLTLTGDLEGARRALDLALAMEPTSSNGHLILGDLELAAGRVDAARAAFQKALRLDPDNRDAMARLQRLPRSAPR
jgi:tetratricopeptide (TPR) repeat protein